ncbi:HyaD/HybD family hydrogenase maturation endopeptidase [Thermochromatium tepidum]|jgi:hydrogenase maturation protease|uniref:Hydrogenase maturation protease n=1 Tax=Thermochromatium tepidum ATCC 43061 TaxID=316276 RepID=A0A6I6ED96_THETI|nr:HyaD/HybD family hydrogenase maturation endopeptidase [Thermochromatium tepidum]QGU32929.1 hydrogenase maturation protease [Thermochromatium tepidum ATCC 43061]
MGPESETPTDPGTDVLLLGLGNLLLSDEGVGVQVVRRLERDYRFEPAIRLIDGGTSGLDLLPLFADHRRILMIDAIALAAPPGQIAVLRDAEIRSALSPRLSVHHLGLSDLLALAQWLDDGPTEIVLVGIVPECLELGLELSPSVAAAIPAVIEQVGAILSGWGVAFERVSATQP